MQKILLLLVLASCYGDDIHPDAAPPFQTYLPDAAAVTVMLPDAAEPADAGEPDAPPAHGCCHHGEHHHHHDHDCDGE